VTALFLVIGLAAAWVAFGTVGYPLLLLALRRVAPLRVERASAFHPAVTIIVAVHDGERELAGKLENTLALDYPGPRQVIVASDGSTDGTGAVAAGFADRGVELVATASRRGKEAAQAAAIAEATGEILVFTDVGARLAPGALCALVAPLADPRIGAVSSEDRVDAAEGEGAYVRYEMALRRLESEATTLIGLSGSCFAMRRALASGWRTDLASDFRTALECARRGLRAVSEPAAQVSFRVVSDPRAEWARKVRTVRRGIAVLAAYPDLLHPRRGRAALSLWGHKVARFTSPFALLVLFGASAAAAPRSGLAALLVFAQLLLYGLGGLALVARPLRERWLPRLASFFLLVNASTLVAWAYHLSGRRAVTWQPTRR
jgi:cellulose synthase/poly-beta-1,6-N-acetylglucosamine synthase-like glycosyltransferase